LEEQALDLLEAGYRAAEYEKRSGQQFLLTFLDGDVAEAAGRRMPNKTSLRQLRVDLGHAVRSAPHRSFRFP
jgi:hypothetical protein